MKKTYVKINEEYNIEIGEKNMIEELRQLIIFEYAAKKKAIDENFYRRIVEIVSKKYELKDYVRDIKFEPIEQKNSNAAYNNHEKTITIDTAQMDEFLTEVVTYLPAGIFNSAEIEVFRYLEAARILLHEMTHAIQNKDSDYERIHEIPGDRRKIMAGVNPFFTGNLIYSIQRNEEESAYHRLKKWTDYQGKKYGYDVVHERDAEIQSFSMAYSMLTGLENVFPNLRKYMKANFNQAITMGYDIVDGKIVSPIYRYARVLTKNDMISSDHISWYHADEEETLRRSCSEYPSASDRLKMGMPVTAEEYYKVLTAHDRYKREGFIVCSYIPRLEQDNQEL